MKKVVIFACVATGLVGLFLSVGTVSQKKRTLSDDKQETRVALDSLDVKNMPVLKFAKTRHDFGTAKTNSQITVRFEFRNEGGVPLVIQKVDVSCGCLSADYPKQPTIPNGEGIIEAKIDTKDYTGAFNKTLFVKSNATEDVILLRILGQIK